MYSVKILPKILLLTSNSNATQIHPCRKESKVSIFYNDQIIWEVFSLLSLFHLLHVGNDAEYPIYIFSASLFLSRKLTYPLILKVFYERKTRLSSKH